MGILLLQMIFLKWSCGKQVEHIISLFLLFQDQNITKLSINIADCTLSKYNP